VREDLVDASSCHDIAAQEQGEQLGIPAAGIAFLMLVTGAHLLCIFSSCH
jgi:hypothetical protein